MKKRFLESPVRDQDFIWIAHYYDQTHLSEFDFETQTENSFEDINKDKLIRFGLIGYGMNLYYEVLGGTFKLAGQVIDVVYKVKDKEYHLTSRPMTMYKDIIQYKHAEAIMTTNMQNVMKNSITQYNFGYKQNLNIDDVNFNFKAICCVPYGGRVYMHFRLVADKDLNGTFCIKRNGLIIKEIYAPLKKNMGGELNWEVK